MSDITYLEKNKLEKYFGMSSGYVLDFSNRTFQEFIRESTGKDIYDSIYENGSGSKANRLRAFWKEESNYIVGKLISDMINYCDTLPLESCYTRHEDKTALRKECLKIAARLKDNSIVEHIDSIKPISDDKDFSVLADSIREMIQKNQPEAALDRLHTFTTKYVRELCDRHGISYDKDKPLHSIYGEYIKKLKGKKAIHSVMTERILKTSISVLEAFNEVRNKQSFAHDNPLLNYDESVLIFSNISSTIKFIESVEKSLEKIEKQKDIKERYDDLPF